MGCVSHGISGIRLYPLLSGRQTRYQAVTLSMSANLILLIIAFLMCFCQKKKCFFKQRFGLINEGSVYILRMNYGGFDTEIR